MKKQTKEQAKKQAKKKAAKKKAGPAAAGGYRIKIVLRWSNPTIWRAVCVPPDLPLDWLHAVIQLAMGWEDSHLHHFKQQKTYYGIPSPDSWMESDIEDERSVTVADIFPKKGSKIEYEYDFGDGWIHDLTSLGPMQAGDRLFEVYDGAMACPPEDCGGIGGYYGVLEALADPAHEAHGSFAEWLGEDFDPERFDREKVSKELRKVLGVG